MLAPAAHARRAPSNRAIPRLNRIWSAQSETAFGLLAPGPLTVDSANRPCAIDLPEVILDGAVRDRCPYVGDEWVIGRTLDASEPPWDTQRAMLAWFAAAQHGDGSILCSPLDGANATLMDHNAYWVQALDSYVLYSGDVGSRARWPNLVKLPRHLHTHIQGGSW
jgi:hypothetical protein